jgi:hypothetical protein
MPTLGCCLNFIQACSICTLVDCFEAHIDETEVPDLPGIFFPHRDISSNNAYGELTQWMIDLNEVYILLLGNCEALETYILFSSVISTTIDLCVAGCSLFLPKQRVVITTTLLDAQETA